MRSLTLELPGPLNLLVVGARADDVGIGAGTTIQRLQATEPGSSILWVVAYAAPEREAEAPDMEIALGARPTACWRLRRAP